MSAETLLARLVAQAAAEGGELVTLRAIVEEASEVGAARALSRLGLADDAAHEDLGELRELLGAWRAAKASAWKATVEWTVRLVFALLLIGIAVRLNVPELAEVTRFAGYAALFGIADAGGDTIVPGAFARALAEKGEVPLFWQHDPAQLIGRVESLAEDGRGLRVIARLEPQTTRAAALLQGGAVSGLSFGYRARGYTRVPEGRVLQDIDLLEVSLVTDPLQPGARVHLVR